MCVASLLTELGVKLSSIPIVGSDNTSIAELIENHIEH